MSENQKNSGVFAGDIDPEIADLMGIDEEPAADGEPAFEDLFEEERPQKGDTGTEEVDLSKEKFPEITRLEEAPKPYFTDKNYYKKLLSGEGTVSNRVHELLTKFLKAEDPQDKSLYRSKLIPAFWDLAGHIAHKIYKDLSYAQMLLLRFGVLLPTLISAEQRKVITTVICENTTGEPVHYVDEWLKKVALGEIRASATDETKVVRKNDNERVRTLYEKARGQHEIQLGLIRGKIGEIETVQSQLKNVIEAVFKREEKAGYPGLSDVLRDDQRANVGESIELLKKILMMDKELGGLYRELEGAEEKLQEMKDKLEELGDSVGVDDEGITKEFNTVRQMAKLCVGRQGNHFPVLLKQYMRSNIMDVATRENVIRQMAAIEAIDPGLFHRTFKRQTNRIVPHIILVPCYGDKGICWEPFEKFNKATSRGRVAVPLYPKDIKTAVLFALGDLRWQVAKEKAQHYWMEEGLTGKYYQYFEDNKMKGDVKEAFIEDYILWINKESEGTQKLTRDARGVFWRNIPFPQEIKDRLKNRGFVYNELYKKDVNISMSDGY